MTNIARFQMEKMLLMTMNHKMEAENNKISVFRLPELMEDSATLSQDKSDALNMLDYKFENGQIDEVERDKIKDEVNERFELSMAYITEQQQEFKDKITVNKTEIAANNENIKGMNEEQKQQIQDLHGWAKNANIG